MKDTIVLNRRLDELVESLESTEQFSRAYKKMDGYIKEIKYNLPENKKCLALKVDDSFIDVLILFEEYFYKQGYSDGIRQKGIFKKIIKWFVK
jgi:hypothetical protein